MCADTSCEPRPPLVPSPLGERAPLFPLSPWGAGRARGSIVDRYPYLQSHMGFDSTLRTANPHRLTTPTTGGKLTGAIVVCSSRWRQGGGANGKAPIPHE